MIGLILNHRDIIKLLISRGADINMQQSGGLSAIHLAILSNRRGNTNEGALSVEKLFGLHYSKDFVNESEAKDLIELLPSNGANVNAKNDNGLTLLHMVSLKSTKEIAEILISHGAKINPLTKNGLTPLDIAVGCEKIDYEIFLRLRKAKMDYQYYLDSFQEASKIVAFLKLNGGKANSGDIRMTEFYNVSYYLNDYMM